MSSCVTIFFANLPADSIYSRTEILLRIVSLTSLAIHVRSSIVDFQISSSSFEKAIKYMLVDIEVEAALANPWQTRCKRVMKRPIGLDKSWSSDLGYQAYSLCRNY